MNRKHAIALGAAKFTLGVSLAVGFATYTPPALADGPEDAPGWSCVDDGNRVCGPGNAQGAPAGCYDDGGVLSAYWPCAPWQPADGWMHGDGSITYPDGPCDPGPDSDRPCTTAQAGVTR